jgi:phosphatidylserine/phosphatidylglycerophosphate/cardiolipin synthase-like enzyme
VLRVTGPAVLELQYIFTADWFLETDEVLDGDDIFSAPEIAGPIPMQALASGPDFPTQNNQPQADQDHHAVFHSGRTDAPGIANRCASRRGWSTSSFPK